MNKKLRSTLISVVAMSASLVFAETDAKALKEIQDIRKGVNNQNQIEDLRVLDTATIGGNVTVGGTIAVTGNTTLSGSLDVDSVTVDAGAGIDNQAAGALLVGAATATSVEIADAGVTTDIQGPVTVLGGIDTAAAAALVLGAATATSVEIADAGVVTDIQGTLSVDQAATFDSTVAIIGSGIVSDLFTAEHNVLFDNTNNVARTFTQSKEYTMVIAPNELGTVTNAQSLGAVATWYTIDAAGAVTCAVDNASAKGQIFNIVNTGAATITFADSGNLKLSGDAVLGQYDILSLYAADTNIWVETSQVDN